MADPNPSALPFHYRVLYEKLAALEKALDSIAQDALRVKTV